jgi:hypothetical protein
MNLKPLISFFACCVLIAAAFGASLVHVMKSPVDQVVICVGSGSIVVSVDEEGQPVAPKPICPECIGAFADLAHLGQCTMPMQTIAKATMHWSVADLISVPFVRNADARGPPRLS